MPADSTPNPPKRAMPKLWSPDTAAESAAVAVPARPSPKHPFAKASIEDNSIVDESRSDAAPAEPTPAEQAEISRPHRPRTPSRTYVALPFARTPVAAAKKAPRRADAPPRYSPTIKELPLSDRPRERLATHGAQALTTAELLAILIRVGNAERSAVSLGEQLLAHFGSVNEVAAAPVEQLSGVKGIGDAKAAQIKAAIEFGRRVSLFGSEDRPYVSGPRDAANLVISDLRYLKKETLKSILLDTKGRVIAVKTVSIGDLSSSIVHPREVFKDAIVASAASIIVAHNHPSGDPTPSAEDVEITKRLMSAGEILGIELLDHLVIGDAEFVSLKERGLV